jgi:predicted dehydrogenase
MATIEAGKALVCEKPLATTAEGSWRMYDAAERAGIVHQTGLNFRLSPALQLAQKLVGEGAIGEVQNFRGFFMHDVYADAQAPYTWHNKRAEAGGAITDSGVHAIDFARNLVGEIDSVVATSYQVTEQRPGPDGNMVPVDVEDNALVLLRFESGAPGTIESTRATLGKKYASGFELFGTRGALVYDYERNQELRYYDGSDAPDRSGFRTILVRPEYPREDLFFPLPGTGMNWPDMKVIQLAELADAITAGRPLACDLGDAWRAQEVAEAALRSIDKNGWEKVVADRSPVARTAAS